MVSTTSGSKVILDGLPIASDGQHRAVGVSLDWGRATGAEEYRPQYAAPANVVQERERLDANLEGLRKDAEAGALTVARGQEERRRRDRTTRPRDEPRRRPPSMMRGMFFAADPWKIQVAVSSLPAFLNSACFLSKFACSCGLW